MKQIDSWWINKSNKDTYAIIYLKGNLLVGLCHESGSLADHTTAQKCSVVVYPAPEAKLFGIGQKCRQQGKVLEPKKYRVKRLVLACQMPRTKSTGKAPLVNDQWYVDRQVTSSWIHVFTFVLPLYIEELRGSPFEVLPNVRKQSFICWPVQSCGTFSKERLPSCASTGPSSLYRNMGMGECKLGNNYHQLSSMGLPNIIHHMRQTDG